MQDRFLLILLPPLLACGASHQTESELDSGVQHADSSTSVELLSCYELLQASLLDPGCSEADPACEPYTFGEIPCCSASLLCSGASGRYEWVVDCDDDCAQECERLGDGTSCEVYGCAWYEGGCTEGSSACTFEPSLGCPIDGDCTANCQGRLDETSCNSAGFCVWTDVIEHECLSKEPGAACSRDADCTGTERCLPFSVNPCDDPLHPCQACGSMTYRCM